MLFLAIAATVGWIAFDVAISVVTSSMIPPGEWYVLIFGGVGLGALALLGEIKTWMSQTEERNELLRKVETAAAQQSGKMEVLAILQALQLKSSPIDVTSPTLPVKSVSSEELKEGEREIKDLRKRLGKELSRWPILKPEELQRFTEDIAFLKGKRVCVVSGDEHDCRVFAEAVASAFRTAGVPLVDKSTVFTDFSVDEFDNAGIQIHGSRASGTFAEDLEQAFVECLPYAWTESHVERETPPPDDLIIIKVGPRWPHDIPQDGEDKKD